jgi:hypothetical protein
LLTFSPVRDPAVEETKFPNLVALYRGLDDHQARRNSNAVRPELLL